MQFVQLGATGVYVSRIALGTMTFGGAGVRPWSVIGGLDLAAADRLVGASLDAGVNLIDTADMYAAGECESMVGEILKSRRDDVVLATKLAARMGPGPNQVGLSRLHVMRALEDSLRRLRTDHIDLYQIHGVDPVTPIEETLGALDDAVRQGKVRYLGASNFAAWQMSKALGVSDRRGLSRFVSSQSYYSLAGRDIKAELVPMLAAEKVGLLVWSPLAGGFLLASSTGPAVRTARPGGRRPICRRWIGSGPSTSSTCCARSPRGTGRRPPGWRWPGCWPSRR
jgi:aryl-alcohol dehydrogenase-like predicted oxidoreductase